MSSRTRSVSGRWGGELTRRAIPEVTDEARDLDPALREALAKVWWLQAATERRVIHSFELVHESLTRLGAPRALIELAERGVDDEVRHTELCMHMARGHGGEPLGEPLRLAHYAPTHAGADAGLRDPLIIVGQCVFNETFASAYLDAARHGCERPAARAALSELLSDEIDHSRVGWALLASLGAAGKSALTSWLLPLAVTNLREWRKLEEGASPFPDAKQLEAHGVPRREVVREALDDIVRGVIIPGLEHVGLDTRELHRWVRAGLPLH